MRRFAFPVLFLLAVATLVWADGAEIYKSLRSAPAENVTGATAGDSTVATTSLGSTRIKRSDGNTTVVAQVDFSGTAGDTVVLYFIPYFVAGDETVTLTPGIQQVTATAGALTDAAGDNFNINAIFFDIPAGATHYEVRHGTPSAGNIDMTYVAYGVAPK